MRAALGLGRGAAGWLGPRADSPDAEGAPLRRRCRRLDPRQLRHDPHRRAHLRGPAGRRGSRGFRAARGADSCPYILLFYFCLPALPFSTNVASFLLQRGGERHFRKTRVKRVRAAKTFSFSCVFCPF